jgi:hypothetical protein
VEPKNFLPLAQLPTCQSSFLPLLKLKPFLCLSCVTRWQFVVTRCCTPQLYSQSSISFHYFFSNYLSTPATMAEQPRCLSLESLPIELRSLILQNLPDIRSLISSLLAHSSLYDAFRDDHTITVKVLKNQISPPSLLYHALAVHQSASLRPRSRHQVQELLNSYHKTASTQLFCLLPQVSLSDALRMAKIYEHVVFFTANFVSVTLPLLSSSKDTQDSLLAPPSPSELHRIQRSFYRFELYCNLFRRHRRSKPDTLFSAKEQGEIFFKRYSPSENEQLACIHDYLLQQLSKCRINSHLGMIRTPGLSLF